MKQLGIPGIAGILVGELIVDLFAGGGGASAGIEAALGRPPDIAINHDPHAIQMHEANHPATRHYCQSVFHREVHPLELVKGQRVGLLWLSPDCRHFSRARGSAPVSASVRALCWIGLRWAKFARPRVVVLENVPEFITAGPLLPNGKPNKKRAGEHFRAFVREWKKYGYAIEWRNIVCVDHGARTTRKRLFLVARCDGLPIEWPEVDRRKDHTAADCIDWSLPCPSIFMTRDEAHAFRRRTGIICRRPLAPKTLRRIARGVEKYVLGGNPFIVSITHGGSEFRGRSVGEPLATITAAHRGEQALVAPTMIRMGHGEKQWNGVHQPLGTVRAQGTHHALVAAFLAKHNKGATGQPATEPLHTATGTDTKSVVAALLTKFNQNGDGIDPREPLPTAMAGAARFGLVAAFLAQYHSDGGQDSAIERPVPTITSVAGQSLVTVTINGTDYAIVDIGMRMLEPRELARAQGFEDSYILTGTKSQQIARIGNSVCPPVAAAIVRANLLPRRAAAA